MSSQSVPSTGTVIAAMFLVSGTIIGGGMLALPVATGMSGFWPSLTFMGISWLAMTFTALLYLEVSLWMEEGVHVITMTSRILGPIGKGIAWILYLFICYASLVAYTAGGGLQIVDGAMALFGVTLSKSIGACIFVAIFGSIFYFGNKTVGRVNTILFLAMIGAYVCLVVMGIDEVKPELLTYHDWRPAILAIPLFLTSFSFQTMVPSLTPYLNRHAKSLRYAIVGGTTLSLIVYIIWLWLILGIVPVEGNNGLLEAHRLGEPATQFISEHVIGAHVALIAEYFAFFAIITSFFGIGLGLFDFLSDGLKIKEEGMGKVKLALLIAIPTLFFATQFERIFYMALDATGGYGDAILNGIIPILLVYIGHYKMGYGKGETSLIQKRPLLFLGFCFYLFVLLFKFCIDCGIISTTIFLRNG
jgi:tyrosine-specific transport protein